MSSLYPPPERSPDFILTFEKNWLSSLSILKLQFIDFSRKLKFHTFFVGKFNKLQNYICFICNSNTLFLFYLTNFALYIKRNCEHNEYPPPPKKYNFVILSLLNYCISCNKSKQNKTKLKTGLNTLHDNKNIFFYSMPFAYKNNV